MEIIIIRDNNIYCTITIAKSQCNALFLASLHGTTVRATIASERIRTRGLEDTPVIHFAFNGIDDLAYLGWDHPGQTCALDLEYFYCALEQKCTNNKKFWNENTIFEYTRTNEQDCTSQSLSR